MCCFLFWDVKARGSLLESVFLLSNAVEGFQCPAASQTASMCFFLQTVSWDQGAVAASRSCSAERQTKKKNNNKKKKIYSADYNPGRMTLSPLYNFPHDTSTLWRRVCSFFENIFSHVSEGVIGLYRLVRSARWGVLEFTAREKITPSRWYRRAVCARVLSL